MHLLKVIKVVTIKEDLITVAIIITINSCDLACQVGNFQGFIIVMIKVVIIIYKEVDDKVVVLIAYYQDLTLKDGDDDEVSMDLIA